VETAQKQSVKSAGEQEATQLSQKQRCKAMTDFLMLQYRQTINPSTHCCSFFFFFLLRLYKLRQLGLCPTAGSRD
jgi:hypothetical protein